MSVGCLSPKSRLGNTGEKKQEPDKGYSTPYVVFCNILFTKFCADREAKPDVLQAHGQLTLKLAAEM